MKYNVKNIIYVSCNPKTFINDMNVFQENGYILIKATPVDMFPYTGHLDMVTKLVKSV